MIRNAAPVALAACLLACAIPAARAQGFAALVSPPRFELQVKPGESHREVIEITNASAQAAKYHVRTADWTLSPDGAVKFVDALMPASCRPWVALEAHDITVSPGGKYRYRFDVAPPAGAAAGECRFAVLIEGGEQKVELSGGPSFPIAARLGVIIYVQIGAAAPKLEVVGAKVATVEQQKLPVVLVKNSGNAHGRLTGFLSGTDAAGQSLEFTPSTLPILPGETRAIPLTLHIERGPRVTITYPITIRGNLEWSGGKTPFEQTFKP
ncbi:MAG TPA: hypothetical protein VEG27_09140 [Usitatibacter sp.]|nr:hypothetical protein [Usitatibacter sp.]